MKMQTDNLTQFKRIENRDICRNNVEKIKNSLKQKNLLELRPIIVNERMEIIDGQHRIEACKELGLPIWYEVQKGTSCDDIILLQNQDRWTIEDYITFYCKKGYSDYIYLRDFMKKYNIKTRGALELLSYKQHKLSEIVRLGKFKLREGISNIDDLMNNVSVVRDKMIAVKGNVNWLKSSQLKEVIAKFLKRNDVDFKMLLLQLEIREDWILQKPSIPLYREMLLKIYNFRSRNPIPNDEVKDSELI